MHMDGIMIHEFYVCLNLSVCCSGFSIVANSLLAYASVNHLHYHTLYVKEPVLAATVVRCPARAVHVHVSSSQHVACCVYVDTRKGDT